MNTFVLYCFDLRSQAHLFHFQTQSYAEHKALNAFYDELIPLVDQLVETYQGAHDRIKLSGEHEAIENYKDNTQIQQHIETYVKKTKKLKEEISDSDSDIQSILDDMIGLGNQTLYMLSLS